MKILRGSNNFRIAVDVFIYDIVKRFYKGMQVYLHSEMDKSRTFLSSLNFTPYLLDLGTFCTIVQH